MAKLGVGVGEEFPVDEAATREPASETNGSERHCGRGRHGHSHSWHGNGRWHFAWHILFRLAILGLLIGAVLSLFDPHHYPDQLHGFYPYPHHFLLPVLGIALVLALVWRRGRWHHRHWHHGPGDGDKEGT